MVCCFKRVLKKIHASLNFSLYARIVRLFQRKFTSKYADSQISHVVLFVKIVKIQRMLIWQSAENAYLCSYYMSLRKQ